MTIEIHRGFLVEKASAGHWLARDPFTGSIMTHHGTSMVCRYTTVEACLAAIDHRVDVALDRRVSRTVRNLSLYG